MKDLLKDQIAHQGEAAATSGEKSTTEERTNFEKTLWSRAVPGGSEKRPPSMIKRNMFLTRR